MTPCSLLTLLQQTSTLGREQEQYHSLVAPEQDAVAADLVQRNAGVDSAGQQHSPPRPQL
jgi:hypothetical protein